MIHLDSDKEATFSSDITYINKPLLYYLAYTVVDSDGNEYPYDLFNLAKDPSIIDKITNL